MFRSKVLWKVFAYQGLILLAAAAGVALVVTEKRGPLAALAVTLVALAATWLFAWRFARSLAEMADASEAIARADANGQRVPIPAGDDERGRIARALNTLDDELRRSMAVTSADRNKLTAILSSMVEGVVAVDRDERIVHMNQVAGRLFEVIPDEVVSRPIWEVTRIREVLETLTATLRSETVGHRVARLPGSTDRFLDLRASPLRAGGGILAGAVLVVHDVTQLRHLETVRRDFIGNVSHELKTPVTAIRGIVETLLDDVDIEADVRHRFLGKISRQANRMSSIVTDLLSLSRLESSDSPLELSPLDVREIVEESIHALQPVAEARQVTIETHFPSMPLMIDGEDEVLRQAIGNLLSNAVKYSPAAGQVDVRIALHGDTVVTEIEDRGPGIEPRHHGRLFERFYRVDAARSRELGGTGLGLAIVKHTALALGGDVAVKSEPGEGSTFSIRLPVSRDGETWEAIPTQDIRQLIS